MPRMIDARPLLNLASNRLVALPLVVLYITDGCNSRCATCDIWKLARRNMSMSLVERLAGEFARLGVRSVVLSGGEAMQHPEWPLIAARFRSMGAHVNLLTNGLFLKKQAASVLENIDQLTVSLDGGTAETYQAIRGVDGLARVLDGMRACAGRPITTRTTVQRNNFRELPQIIDAAKAAGAHKISFLGVDVGNPEAFGPRALDQTPALSAADLPEFARVLDGIERDYAADFASGLMAESPTKLRKLVHYFAALNGLEAFQAPRCNAPNISAVIEVDGSIRPCFFLPKGGADFSELNGAAMIALRTAYRKGERAECERCVCPLYQGPRTLLRQ